MMIKYYLLIIFAIMQINHIQSDLKIDVQLNNDYSIVLRVEREKFQIEITFYSRVGKFFYSFIKQT